MSSNFDRDPRRQQEIRMRPAADRLYRRIFGDAILIERFENRDKAILDRVYAIDVQITLPSGQILLGQEKFLSHEFSKYRTVTVEYHQNQHTKEKGDWFKLAAQFYFVGYCTKDKRAFSPWIMLDWPQTVMATHRGELSWRDQTNKNGRARASFRHIDMDRIPAQCVIARS